MVWLAVAMVLVTLPATSTWSMRTWAAYIVVLYFVIATVTVIVVVMVLVLVLIRVSCVAFVIVPALALVFDLVTVLALVVVLLIVFLLLISSGCFLFIAAHDLWRPADSPPVAATDAIAAA